MVKIVSMPFLDILDPSFDIASTIAYLNSKGIRAKGYYPCIDYMRRIGYRKFNELMHTGVGERIFSTLLFEQLLETHKNEVKEISFKSDFSFDDALLITETFVSEYMEKLMISVEDIILFYMYTRQLVPSLYMAKKIKEKHACKVWLAGFNCLNGLKESLLACFPYIDSAFSEEIEENIYAALSGKPVIHHNTLDFLPTPDYSDFIAELDANKNALGFSSKNCYFQIEFTRGCRWHQCSFCTLNCRAGGGFRERSLNMLIQDYKTLQHRHKTALFLLQGYICSKNWRYIFSNLHKQFPNLHKAHRLILKVQDLQEEDDFMFMKKIGASVLVGTESFCSEYLKKLNKGQTVIENIYVLKMAERWAVPCFHNLMYALPFEEERFFIESKENISYILHLPPPFDDEEFRLTYNSDIYNNPEQYGIKRIYPKDEYHIFPKEINNKLKHFFYNFESMTGNEAIEQRKERWKELLKNWRNVYYMSEISGEPKRESLLYKHDMNGFLQIVDFRYSFDTYELEGYERDLYNFCDKPTTITDIIEYFNTLDQKTIHDILQQFVSHKIMFKENDYYLSLAI